MRLLDEIWNNFAKNPDATAIETAERVVTYSELVSKIEFYRNYFTKEGLASGDRVLLSLKRDLEMHAVVIALFSMGVTYIPIAKGSSKTRVENIGDKVAARWLVGNNWSWKIDARTSTSLEVVERRNVRPMPLPDQLAYIMFTSGSTGDPKGVMISRSAMESFLYAMIERLNLDAKVRMLANTELSFDVSVPEIYLPFIVGGSVVFADEVTQNDLNMLPALLTKCNLAQATPSLWSLLIESGWTPNNNQVLVAGGEALSISLARQLCQARSAWNFYGPTEATVWASSWKIKDSSPRVLLGSPLNNSEFHLLPLDNDEFELGISGACLADGYAADTAATDASFVNLKGRRVYRTGDVVSRHEDGSLEWLRRRDSLVKVRGYRISTLEVKNVVEGSTGITGCAVDVVGSAGSASQLVAYITTNSRFENIEFLENEIRNSIPPYMIPDKWIEVEYFPLNRNGKCDLRRLRQEHFNYTTGLFNHIDSLGAENRSIRNVVLNGFAHVLPITADNVSRDFRSLGVTSSQLMIVSALISRDLTLSIPVGALLSAGSIAASVEYVENLNSIKIERD
ncbi:long-chain-fatty-acid--CoA ligase [Actinomyces sp. Chiba101]|uniref:non-ribosomal peptide synthetase n=1 Tax=Actinomyces TaxID=1654 RepID=UPI000974E925|nr:MULTISPECIES: non-ribosomal peptide synthetase [Actinomyces]BAW91970.1 long-chain-fatty-acid--CoA ligase [Actinomyces sp. Chiba101]GAV95102.1 long-chain-fatty-acid--CoA ligase [Actinomyces denticolens]SUU12269.1 Polyketide synthase PksJ [Actinomyces denticolens]